MKKYNTTAKNKAKKMYVQEGKSALDISQHFHNQPTAQTIINWVKKEKWDSLREDHATSEYEKSSPKNMAAKIIQKMETIVSIDPSQFTPQHADALAKLQSSLAKISDVKYQLPMILQTLTDLIVYIREHYPKVITPEFLRAVKNFKDLLKKKLEGGL